MRGEQERTVDDGSSVVDDGSSVSWESGYQPESGEDSLESSSLSMAGSVGGSTSGLEQGVEEVRESDIGRCSERTGLDEVSRSLGAEAGQGTELYEGEESLSIRR